MDTAQSFGFDIEKAMPLVREAVRPYPKAAMFELAEEGRTSLFAQLVSCMLSIRTYDEVSIVAARGLFKAAPGASEIAELSIAEIDALIDRVTFHERKAAQIKAIARQTVDEFGGELPCDRELLLSFAGVGPKCANLALGIACGAEEISVDIHVHRVTNRWGYVQTSHPEATLVALEALLPKKYWIEINALLVPFGKHICTGVRPKCSACPLRQMCPKIGVIDYR